MGSAKLGRGQRLFLLGALTFATLLPFTGKAFHIDDPMYLWAAKQIQSEPLDPYGLEVNWYGFPMPMSEVNKNPPLTSYYIAVVAGALGWGERTLHLAFLLPAIVVVVGTYLLAERLSRRPLLAGFCALFTPVFLVSSTNLMSDTLMLAFWVIAVYLWITGMKRGSKSRLIGAGVAIALAAVTKYYGMALIPLLFVYSIVEKRGLTRDLAYLLIPVVLLAGYQWWTQEVYGRGLLLDAASYPSGVASRWGRWSIAKLVIGLGFTGGCLGAVWLFTLGSWPRWALAAGGLAVGLVAVLAVYVANIGVGPMGVEKNHLWGAALLMGVFAAGGLVVLAMVVREAVRHRDAESMLLCLWILGTFVFAAGLNWTTNGRSILPMVPAAAILIARSVDAGKGTSALGALRTAVVGVISAALAIGVAWADFAYAESARVAARRIHTLYGGYPLLFEGHWGFQHYMEAAGAKALNLSAPSARVGDILVVPQNNTNVYWPKEEWASRVETIEIPASKWIATMRSDLGAGFYADEIGPLPFAVGKVPAERYHIFLITPKR